MSIAFSVLASGSSGNAAVLRRSAAAPALIDAGLSPRRTAEHLGALGVRLEDVRDVLLVHAGAVLPGGPFITGPLPDLESAPL